MRTLSFVVVLSVLFASLSLAQTPDSLKSTIDTTLPSTAHSVDRLWHRPQAEREGSNLYFTAEALRYYGSPANVSQLLDESGGAYPLLLGDESYGRESFVVTSRTGEGIVSSMIDGVLLATSILNGTTLSNYFPMSSFSDVSFNSGAGGLALTGADYSASDQLNYSIERFRAPVPYSRIKYTQDLARSNSVFDGLFSVNASSATNLAFGISRRSTGSTPNVYDPTFNPRSDLWSARVQMSIDHYLGSFPRDSTMTQHKIDSILATPDAKAHSLDFLVWGQYTTAFSGLSGGILPHYTDTDIFDSHVAQVLDNNTFDHRVRMDAVAELELPLLAEARTKLSAFASYESRHILSRDSTFPSFIPDEAVGRRLGTTLVQPLTIAIGDFLNRASIEGNVLRIDRDRVFTYGAPISDTRLSATASDSVALRTAFRIALFGFVRTTQSNLKIGSAPIDAKVFPSVGFSGSIGFSNAISFSANYFYSQDRAALSPSPSETYQLRNIGGYFDFRIPISRFDSIALHAGVLYRDEPEGVIYDYTNPALPLPKFSNLSETSEAALLNLDAYFSHFHLAGSMTYFPAQLPISSYTTAPEASSDLLQRFYGFVGFYFENEVGEGNLRLSFGPRVRYINRLDPELTYDRASDYYLYEGAAVRVDANDPSNIEALGDSRVTTPKALVDVLLAMEIDRRAQINMSLLNVLSTPFYNVSFYPRQGFHWKLDVTWAFLD